MLGQAAFQPELETSISDVVERLAPTWRVSFDRRILGIPWGELFPFIELPEIEFSEFFAQDELLPLLSQSFLTVVPAPVWKDGTSNASGFDLESLEQDEVFFPRPRT